MEILNKDGDQIVSDKFINFPNFQMVDEDVVNPFNDPVYDELMELLYFLPYDHVARDLYRLTSIDLNQV